MRATHPAAAEVAVELLLRSGVPAHAATGGWPVTLEVDGSLGDGEAHRLRASADGISGTAGSPAGLVRAAATVSQLLRAAGNRIEVATGEIHDEPTVPLRMLAGWGLHRSHQLEWALDVAVVGKANRVLYNWWTAVPGERLGGREARLVEQARERGIELVCELRRQVLGPGFTLADDAAVRSLLDLYDEALDRGFRCFGLLFDDTDLDPVADELALLEIVHGHLASRLGEEPELWFCPRFYWFAGEADYSWFPRSLGPPGPHQVDLAPAFGGSERRSPEEATARQRGYHELLSGVLPEGTLVYLASWWHGTPGDWASQLEEQWTSLVGRPPAFWDNQQQNDYRLSLIVPFPLHDRPAGFAEAITGYALNSGVPLAAYAAASVTALAWAWNPHGYEPEQAFADAVHHLLGPEAAPPALDAVRAWRALVDGLRPEGAGAAQHVAGLREAVASGRADSVRADVAAVAERLAASRRQVPPERGPMAAASVDELRRDCDRLLLELRLAELAAAGAGDDLPGDAVRAEARRVGRLISDHLAGRLPPTPDLDQLLQGPLDLSRPSPGLSWALHFHATALAHGAASLLADLDLPPPWAR